MGILSSIKIGTGADASAVCQILQVRYSHITLQCPCLICLVSQTWAISCSRRTQDLGVSDDHRLLRNGVQVRWHDVRQVLNAAHRVE